MKKIRNRHNSLKTLMGFIKKNARIIFALALTILFLATTHYLCIKNIESKSRQPFFAFEIIASFFFYCLTIKTFRSNRMQKLSSIAISCFLSLIFSIGSELNSSNYINVSFYLLVKIVFFFLVYYIFVSELLDVIYKLNFNKKKFTIDKGVFLKTYLIFLTIGLLYYIILYPGIFSYDMAKQNTFFVSGNLTSHWSLVYGAILNLFIELGNAIFNSYTVGFAIIMFMQMLFMSYVYTRITLFSSKLVKHKLAIPIIVLFFILVPFFGVMAVTAAQDTFFGGLFALFIINFYDLLNSKTISKTKICTLIALAFISCTVRNNAVYCFVATLIIFIFIKKKYFNNKKIVLFILFVPVLLSFIYTGPFFNLLNISKTTGIQEILSIPSQQIARAYFVNKNSFSDDDLDKLGEYYELDSDTNVFTFNKAEQYPLLADYSKGALNSDTVSKNIMSYITFWARIGIKNPKLYIEAFLLNSIGFWYPGKNYDDPRIHMGYQNYPGFSDTFGRSPDMKPIQRENSNSLVKRGLDSIIFNNEWQNIPIIAQLSSIGLYFTILFICIILLLIHRSWSSLSSVSPILFLAFTLLLAPVAIFRYAYPIGILIPLLVSITINSIVPHRTNNYKQ